MDIFKRTVQEQILFILLHDSFYLILFYLPWRDGQPLPSINIEIEKKASVRVGSREMRSTEKDQCMNVYSKETRQEKDINVDVSAR